MNISVKPFGQLPSGEKARLFTLVNDFGISLQLTDYGGIITSVCTPDKNGVSADIVTGYPDWNGWLSNEAYFGALIGRTCNRIGNARFSIDGTEYKVSPNQGRHQLHGGFEGFNKKLWKAESFENSLSVGVRLEYLSTDGEEGFPGNLKVQAVYSLNNQNEISMEFRAVTDQPTPVNLTNHAYFNLAGENSGDVLGHQLLIFADQITETDSDSIPTGKFLDVKNTPFDFTSPHPVGERIQSLYMGYDDNYVLRNQSGKLAACARVFDPVSGRLLEISTSEPGVQLYTSNWFDGKTLGKGGVVYRKYGAFALETQHYPDSMNHPGFPDVILRPGKTYASQTVWKFSIAGSI